MPGNIKRATTTHISSTVMYSHFPLIEWNVNGPTLSEISICFICSELQKIYMQNVFKLTHDTKFSSVEPRIIDIKTFFVKQEMSPYFATLTYLTPLLIRCLCVLFHHYHCHSHCHQLHEFLQSRVVCNFYQNTVTIWTIFTNIFIVEMFIQKLYLLFNLCEQQLIP